MSHYCEEATILCETGLQLLEYYICCVFIKFEFEIIKFNL